MAVGHSLILEYEVLRGSYYLSTVASFHCDASFPYIGSRPGFFIRTLSPTANTLAVVMGGGVALLLWSSLSFSRPKR